MKHDFKKLAKFNDMKKKNNTYFIDSSLSDYDYLVLDNLNNLNEEHDKTIKEDEKVSDSVYFHGSVEDIEGYLNKPINWITKDFDYAKTFALGNGYVYECSANLGNLLDVGKTDARVFDLIPSNPLKLSREFTAIARKLNVSEEAIRKIISNVASEYGVDEYRLAIRPVVRSMAFKRILEGLGYNGVRAIEYDSVNNKDVETFGLFDQVKVLGKVDESLNEKNYPQPEKIYNVDKDTAYWPDDAEDWIWWKSEADKWAEDYAKSYRVKMSPKDYLDLTTDKGADAYKVGDSIGGGELRTLDVDELNKEKYQNIFLQIAFRDKNRPEYAVVTGHEGRHRMFALMNAGVKSVDVELICETWDTNYNKYKPFKLDKILLQGQFNKSVFVTIYNPIPMSWKNHKAMRPNLKDESLNEDEKNTSIIYTYQSPEVLKQLQNGETYIASYERGMLSNDSYKELARILGLNNCPIFGGLSKEDTEDMMDSSGLDVDDKVLIKLEVPTSEVHKMGYYDWTDYIYYYVDGQEEPEWSREEFENILRNYSGNTPCQVVIDRIEPKWLVNSEDVSITPDYDEDDVDIVDNTKTLMIITKQNHGYTVSVSDIDDFKDVDWDDLNKESIIKLLTKYSNAQSSSSYPFSDISKEGIADVVKKGEGWSHPRKFGTNSINEYFDEVEDSGEQYHNYEVLDNVPIFVTDEVYKIKQMLENDNTPYRILYLNRQKCYLIQNALGNKTHYDMYETAVKKGFISEDYFDNEDYFVVIPKDFSGKLRWSTSLGEDDYFDCRVYSFGTVFVRDAYAYNNILIQALGVPDREVYYDTEDEKVTILKGEIKKVMDVYDDLNGQPNNAITQSIE